MVIAAGRSLDELKEPELYRLLGQAWYAQCKPNPGEAYLLESAAKIGKREFDALVPVLSEDLGRPHFYGVVACVAGTIRRCATWPMPADVVATLVVQRGLGLSDHIISRIFGSDLHATDSHDDKFVFLPNLSDSLHSTDDTTASNSYCIQTLPSEFESSPKSASVNDRRANAPAGDGAKTSAAILLLKPKRKPELDRLLS